MHPRSFCVSLNTGKRECACKVATDRASVRASLWVFVHACDAHSVRVWTSTGGERMRRSSWRLGRLNSRCWKLVVRVPVFLVLRVSREFVRESYPRANRYVRVYTVLRDAAERFGLGAIVVNRWTRWARLTARNEVSRLPNRISADPVCGLWNGTFAAC